ncbi:MAG: DEAD/DEAH box helicase [Chloroflexota bacterium]|nr:DEAD/DEAH box helicase [Chloroflexota bacterium]
MSNEFNQLNLHPQLVQTVFDLGYTTPTPIQCAAIPMMLAGHDVIGQAQTGTGKTAAFALPILQTLSPGQRCILSLVLVPTRELSMQVSQVMCDYGRKRGVSVLAVYGGQPYSRQIGRIRQGVDIIVGTPGRVLDLIRQKALDLSSVRTVVLDEADEMLSMGFIEDIEAILNETPSSRQTALFSATLPPAIRGLANRYMRDPQSVTMQQKHVTVSTIEQRCYLVNGSDKLAALTRLLEVEEIASALIFVRTRVGTNELANELTMRGFPVEALNGDLSQNVREQVLNRFRRNHTNMLVATDVAARGLDIDDISHVINYDLPQDPELYVHRVGRTARAGKAGMAISLLTPKERWHLRNIEAFTRQKITRVALPTVEEIEMRRKEQLVEQMLVRLRRGRYRKEREIVAELGNAGYDPVEIAAAALKLARTEEGQRPIAPITEVNEVRSRRNGFGPERGNRASNGNGHRRANESGAKGVMRRSVNMGRA